VAVADGFISSGISDVIIASQYAIVKSSDMRIKRIQHVCTSGGQALLPVWFTFRSASNFHPSATRDLSSAPKP